MSAYQIVSSASLRDLVAMTNHQMESGWKPIGGPGYDGTQYFQALTR